MPDQKYSVGIHPWSTIEAPSSELWSELERICALPMVVAIGEAGIDAAKGGPMFRQLQVLKRVVELSESLGKPLVLHDVKAHDIIIGVRRDLNATQPWIIHGFRGKPTVAKMLLDAGLYLSFGEKFNPDSLAATPLDRLLAETDDSPLTIQEVIAALSASLGQDLTPHILATTAGLHVS